MNFTKTVSETIDILSISGAFNSGNDIIRVLLATYHDWIHCEDSTLEYKRSGTEIIKFETDEVFLMEELLVRLGSCLILIPEYDTEANQSLTPNFRKIAILQAIKKSIFTVIKTRDPGPQ